jgi:3,4-dihydroxy-2-butanone 4-phosphate synthase
VPPRDPRPRRNGEHTPQQQTVTGPPERRAASVPLPPASDGFVFGRQSVEAVLAALRNGSIVLLLEDGEETTRASLVASAAHVSTEQLQFLLEHTVRLQAALETERYRTVYRSLRRIVLDNNDLSRPAISVSARCGGTSPRNATHVARAVHALLADALTDGSEEEEAEAKAEASAEASAAAAAAASGQPVRRVGRDPAREVCASVSSLVCPGAVSLGAVREGGVLRRAGATEASVELAKLAGLPAVGLHASLRIHSRTELELFAQRHHLTVSSTADLVAYVRSKQQLVERTGPDRKSVG